MMLNKSGYGQKAAILLLVLAPSTVAAQEGCDALDTGITIGRVQEYAPLIADAAGTIPERVEFLSFMESGNWSAIYAATPVADPGYFFFETADGKKQLKDVWGGIASTSEHAEQVSFAKNLGAPGDLATCFADQTAVVDD